MRIASAFLLAAAVVLSVCCANAGVIYSNGPLVTHPGGGAGGADASALQTALAMNTLGWGVQASVGNRLADDFTVPGSGWTIDSVTLYGYQTGEPTSPSTFTGATLQIWNGRPGDVGSSVVFGDTATNRLLSSSWSNIYRVEDTDLVNTNRPIMANAVSVGTTLGPGTYWLDWDFAGSGAAGPWGPPVTILGQTTTGNARQYTLPSGAWRDANDSGTSTQQDFPFELNGPTGVIPEPSTFGLLALGVGALGLALRRRGR